ncbi:MAG: hypothetical protein VB030_06595 [Eubacterium aggregans]|uniref:hypothetical protein n=1 Tax=Eubacterium aggregans TaxID=81409 RepID=UPI0023F0A50D|nr:hypothetical protein [Eubacterium aggregans]MDD4691392.1 hypothetical protein [Eubacterium aggregans]MEA5073824.1 hypothetical protein [Eubacterium aggregans]
MEKQQRGRFIKRRMSLFLSCLLVLSMLGATHLILNDHHPCTGADCPVCHTISACQNLLSGDDGLAGQAVALVFGCILFYGIILFRGDRRSGDTPVSLKVKLLN